MILANILASNNYPGWTTFFNVISCVGFLISGRLTGLMDREELIHENIRLGIKNIVSSGIRDHNQLYDDNVDISADNINSHIDRRLDHHLKID